MVNLLVPITENPEKYQKALSKIANERDCKVIIGIRKSLKSQIQSSNFKIITFEDKAEKEEMLNSLQPYLEEGKTLIARRAITLEDFDALSSAEYSISFPKNKRVNSIKDFFHRLWLSLTKLIFGVKEFDGDISLIAFDEDLTEVLSQVDNFSYSTRVDRWRGVEKGGVDLPAEKIKFSQGNVNFRLIFAAVIMIAVAIITTTLVVTLAKLNFILGLLLVCLDCICIGGSFILLLSYAFNKRVGKKIYGRAKIMEGNDEEN